MNPNSGSLPGPDTSQIGLRVSDRPEAPPRPCSEGSRTWDPRLGFDPRFRLRSRCVWGKPWLGQGSPCLLALCLGCDRGIPSGWPAHGRDGMSPTLAFLPYYSTIFKSQIISKFHHKNLHHHIDHPSSKFTRISYTVSGVYRILKIENLCGDGRPHLDTNNF